MRQVDNLDLLEMLASLLTSLCLIVSFYTENYFLLSITVAFTYFMISYLLDSQIKDNDDE